MDAFQPLAVLMENVPDVLNHGGQNIAEETCEVLAAKGYVCGYTLLNAFYYGVPQMRERIYNHIQYDHAQARTISVREAARLQSFPDGFAFTGSTMNPAFRQIGNAVLPLLVKSLATQMMKALRGEERETADEPRREAAAVR